MNDTVGAGPVMAVDGLEVVTATGRPIIEDVALSVDRGQVLAIVGESGSGKTTTALALLGSARGGARISRGQVVVGGHDLTALDERDRRALRGRVVSYVPQDPAMSLNPARRIGRQVGEALAFVGRDTEADRLDLLGKVNLPQDPAFLRRYPFELSGGQQQRVAIAMALAADPDLVVLDEPTTGLDVTTQQRIIALVRELADSGRAGFVYISHDLALVSAVADRIAVMYAGRVVEQGTAEQVLTRPQHAFSRILIASAPDQRGVNVVTDADGNAFDVEAALGQDAGTQDWDALQISALPPRPALLGSPPVLEVRDLSVGYGRGPKVLDGVDLSLAAGECLGLVGESGSGKSTLVRTIAGLVEPSSGTVSWRGVPLAARVRRRQPDQLRAVQLIYQNPDRSLNPRESAFDAIARAVRSYDPRLGATERAARVRAAADRVRLPRSLMGRRPLELSGGEKQRVAIARALVSSPELLICDEVTSALDVSTQATIVQLLRELTDDGLAVIYVTHDLGAVRSLAHRIAVLNGGRICESGPCEDVLDRPQDPYTVDLIASTPLMQV